MPMYYVTYGLGSNLAYCYSEVEADDYKTAREHVDEVTKDQFAFMYDTKGFAGQVEKWGLHKVELQPQIIDYRFGEYS